MNFWLAIGTTMLACSCAVYAQSNRESQPPYRPAAKGVDDSINQFEQATNVKVYGDARSQIGEDAGRIKDSNVFIPKERYEDALAWTKDILIKTYLYEVWARNRVQLFITKTQVEAYRLGQFVRDQLTILRDPFGDIDFVSTPVGATIKRDGNQVGSTRQRFVVSRGSHDYEILSDLNNLNCRRTIQVVPGTSQTMACPPATR